MSWNRVGIEALAYEVPSGSLTTASIEEQISPLYRRFGLQPGWLEAVTGIRARRFWEGSQNPTDAAVSAARRCLEQADWDPRRVGVMVSCSVYREWLEPSVACVIHGRVGLSPSCVNFDVGNACLGFLTGMQVVANMIELGQIESGLVVAGEGSRPVIDATLKRLQDPGANMATFRDNLASLTLGSAAVAMLLVRDGRSGHRLVSAINRSATEHANLCFGNLEGMTTNPTKLLAEGVRLAGETWREFGPAGGDRAREYALHQVGKANHEAVIKALGLPESRALAIYPELGNVGSASVITTLAMLVEQGRIGPGDRASLMGIGSGLNVAMMAVDW